MKIILKADGTIQRRLSPLRGVPYYSDWLKALLARGAAREVNQKNKETGEYELKIVTMDRNMEQSATLDADGNVGIICIGCGKVIFGVMHDSYKFSGKSRVQHAKLTDPIRIGCFLQMPVEEPDGDKRTVVRWRVQPVYKLGIGCDECKAKYALAVADANATNELRGVYGSLLMKAADKTTVSVNTNRASELLAAMKEMCSLHRMPKPLCAACNRGKHPYGPEKKVELPSEVVPFIDLFPRDALDGAGIQENL